MKYLKTLVIAFVLLLGVNVASDAQVIVPVGEALIKSSQLVAWYTNTLNSDPNNTYIQVTNVSTSGVTLHIQIWASDLGTGDAVLDPCVEVNFTDTLTPNDTHTYEMDQIVSNNNACNSTSCGSSNEIVDIDGTDFDHGFVTVTPVVSATDRRAIAFNNLIGSVVYDQEEKGGMENAMGRLAVSFLDGSLLPDGTILDGITSGYTLIQPEVLKFNFSRLTPTFSGETVDESRIINIIFRDEYSGPFGDYRSQPADAEFFTLLFDEAEVPTSCSNFMANCIIDQGINERITAENSEPSPDLLLCPGNRLDTGWARLAVTGLDGLENAVGFTYLLSDDNSSFGYARWMVAEGDVVVPTPAPTPTPTETATPTPDGSTSPTGGGQPNGGSGGGSSCAIAGPVQASTAAANMLIVLLPAVGFALRRKFKKS